MRVFGIGLSKTGTCSLTRALNILGIPTVHGPNDPVTQAEFRSGQLNLTILNQFQGITDIPTSFFFKEFDHLYPGSKFILTIRDLESWLHSIRIHYERMPITEWRKFIRTLLYGNVTFEREMYAKRFEEHHAKVHAYFEGRNDLLILDICKGQEWQKLCSFLGKDVPAVPFPHENRTA
jgi:hypothetical protein